MIGASASELTEELLFIFPVLALVSSPSRSIKQAATHLLSILGKTATNLLISPKEKLVVEGEDMRITTPGHIVFRFIRNMWFEVKINYLPCEKIIFFLCISFYMSRRKIF